MIGMLQSFAFRWRDSPEAQSLVPFGKFFTGRMPNPEEYLFPYISVIPGPGRLRYRSDKREGLGRLVSVHIWTDPAELESGEEIAEMVRILYANQAWRYDFGQIIDVLDGGPPNCHQINDPTFTAWETVKQLTLCIEQYRVDRPICHGMWSGSSVASVGTQSGSSSLGSPLPYSQSSVEHHSGALARV